MTRIGIVGSGLGLGHGGVRLTGGELGWLLRDDFLTDAAAPLTSPRTAEPGPGTLTLVQTDGEFSIADGALVFPAQASPAYGDLSLWGDVLTRVAGRSVIGIINMSVATYMLFGYDVDQSGGLDDGTIGVDAGAWVADGSILLGGNAATGTNYSLAVILRTSGAFHFVKGGVFTNWTLAWVSSTGSVSVYPAFSNFNSVGTLDNFRVLDLPAPFNTDYGLATQRLAGAVAAGTTFVHEANCIIEWTQTTVPSSAGVVVYFRMVDLANLWFIYIAATGDLALYERVAGVDTGRATASGVVANGDRIVVIADGTTIRVYEANTLRITYASASNFATATAGEVEALGGGGAVSDLITWPRTLTGSPAAILDQVSG